MTVIAVVTHTSPSTQGDEPSTVISTSTIATWKTVFSFPHRLAGMTSPCSIASWRRPVTANSRAMITIATQADTRLSETSDTSAAVTSSLSASGSISLPNVETLFWRRAIQPSRASVKEASAKTAAASASPPPASCSSAATRTGTSRIRRTVRTFGRLSSNIRRRTLRLQPPPGGEQPGRPGDGDRGHRRRDGERDPGRHVAVAEEPVADAADQEEHRIGVRELVPRAGQRVDRVEHAAQERERQQHDVRDEGCVVPGLRVH